MKLLDSVNKILFHFQKKKQHDTQLGKVLVVSNTGFGDTILSTPAVKSLSKSFPNAKIFFLVNKKYLSLFRNYSYVDKIWKYSGGYLNLFSLIIKCRINSIHTIMLFHSNGPEDIFISLLSGAKNILKCSNNLDHPYKNLFLNEIILQQKHNIEKKIDLVRYFNPNFIDTSLSIADKYYSELPLDYLPKQKKIIGIQIGAQDIYKVWPVENCIKLCQYLVSKHYFLVFFGATQLENEMMKEVESNIDITNICNLVCKTKINDLPYILKRLDLLITNDTGILHLAIAMKVSTLSLFGPTSNEEFGAYQDFEIHNHIQKNGFFVNEKPKKMRNQDGMKLISVNEVITKLEGLL
jgi:ADP-heptose:LPS heptosyltransferase